MYQLPSFLSVHCFALAKPRLSVMHPTVTELRPHSRKEAGMSRVVQLSLF
jgi:hypothetical protein